MLYIITYIVEIYYKKTSSLKTKTRVYDRIENNK